MSADISLAILSVGPGAMLGLLALGLVLIYRSTGTVNLAHGAMATLGAYLYLELADVLPVGLALVTVTAMVGVVGVLVHILVMRPLREASALTKLIASTAVLIIIQSALQLHYGSTPRIVRSALPTDTIHLYGQTYVGVDRIILLAIAIALTAGLWSFYRYTRFGLETDATAESPLAAAAIGLRTERLAVGNWFLAGALAGFAGALLVPITSLNLTQLSALIVPALAAALVGSLSSFPLTLVGGIFIAVAQALVTSHSTTQGASSVVPLAVIIVMMMIRGSSIPSRGFVGARLPAIGSGVLRPLPIVVALGLVLASVYTWLPRDWSYPLLASLLMAVVLLSVVVITGYAGQVSLAQYALAGFGAFMAATVVSDHGWPFLLAVVFAVACAVVLGALLAVPSTRLRGVSLAVVTLSFSVMLQATLFSREESTAVKPPSFFGYDVSPVSSPERYITVVVIVLLVLGLAVANLRRSGTGRRMIAIRNNERLAASLGMNVAMTKVTAFSISAGIAALGGILTAFQTPVVTYARFDAFASINALAWAVIGGVGYLAGPLLGMGFVGGGLGTRLGDAIFEGATWVALIGGIALIGTLIAHPDGIASLPEQLRERRQRRRTATRRKAVATARAKAQVDVAAPAATRVRATLDITGVSVSFGGVQALADVSLTVSPGQVHGLIGPNGAGKTTLLDVISGFVAPSTGTVQLGELVLDRLPTWKRARVGLARSFQNAQLISDLTVLENIRAGSDMMDRNVAARDLVWPGAQRLSAVGWDAIKILELEEQLAAGPDELSYGKRQLVAIARALATDPAVVLLDEPAAGLGEHERAELSGLLRRVADERDIGVLLIEHDVNLVLGVSDWVTVLHGGRVLASGPPETVRIAPEVIAAYLGDEGIEDEQSADAEAEVAGKMLS